MAIRCFFGRHDYEKYGHGTSILGLISKAAHTAIFRHTFGAINPNHESEIYQSIRHEEIDAGRLYDPNHNGTHYNYVDTIRDRVCLRCGKKENRIENYKKFLNHRADVKAFIIRIREDRQSQARRLTDGNC